MTVPKLPVIVDQVSPNGDTLIVRSPAVGVYSHPPAAGALITGSGVAGRLTILNHTYELVLPPGVWGQVREVTVDDRVGPVEYGQVLFRLVQQGFEGLGGEVVEAEAAEDGAVEGTHCILSPTDGIFYRKPSPDAAPYVSVGDHVTQGQTLALVEVMKCFNPIQYGGPGLPPEAEVVKICAEDGAEIKSEQVLFVVRAPLLVG